MNRASFFLPVLLTLLLAGNGAAQGHPLMIYSQPSASITDESGQSLGTTGRGFRLELPTDPHAKVVLVLHASGYKPKRLELEASLLKDIKRLPEEGVYTLERDLPIGPILAGLILILGVGGAVRWKLRAEADKNLGKASPADFQRGELLGEGATSFVYAASSPLAPGQSLAVKILKPTGVGDESNKLRLLRSLKSSTGLSHPNLVKLYKAGQTEDGRPFLLLERLKGSTLDQFLKREKRLPFPEVLSIALPLCDVLGYLHQQGVVHRDVKPENVFLTSDGGLKLMDLEISRSQESESLTRTGFAIGTPYYIAPEQARGELRPESDQYALGVMLFEMLTGQKPFSGIGPVDLIQQHINKAPPSARQLNPELTVLAEAVINKMLAKNPQSRFPDMEHVKAALEEALGASGDDQTATSM